jgi:broad specificity phosphatase PhoE
MEFVSAAKFFASLAADERVFLLIRHGERNHITPEDPDFGAHVGLTERGRDQALSLGRCIPAEGDMSFFSSPVGRCMETASCIAKGRGIENPQVRPLDCLAEYFVQDYDEYTKVLRAGFYEGICEWLKNEVAGTPRGEKEAFAPLSARSEEMLSMMLEKGECRFNIFATHDAWVVPCLTHFCNMCFTSRRWMNYLTGMAVVTDAQKNVKRIEPVTGLDTGWLSF